jgi:hypothetical protein
MCHCCIFEKLIDMCYTEGSDVLNFCVLTWKKTLHHSYYVREEIQGEYSHLFSRLSETNVNIIFWDITSSVTGFLSPGVLGFKYGPRDGRSFSSVRLGKCHRKGKGKVIPLQARCGPEGIALLLHDRGTRRGWVVSSTPRPLFTPGKEPVPILQEAGWAPGSVWTGGKSRPHRDSIRTVQPVVSHYTDWATRPTISSWYQKSTQDYFFHTTPVHYSLIILPFDSEHQTAPLSEPWMPKWVNKISCNGTENYVHPMTRLEARREWK